MIVSRVLSLILRVAQFVFAGIVLGLASWFLYQRTHYHAGPLGRTIYTLVIAALSVIASLVWMIPTKSSIASYAGDLFFSLAWFVRAPTLETAKCLCANVLQRQPSVFLLTGIAASIVEASGTGVALPSVVAITVADGMPRRPSPSSPPLFGLCRSFLGLLPTIGSSAMRPLSKSCRPFACEMG